MPAEPIIQSIRPIGVGRQSPTHPRKRKNRVRLGAVAVLSLAILVSGSWYLMHRNPDLNDVHVILGKVGDHFLLPTNETPALATVTDSSKVQSNFRGKVQNGDKILIYQVNQSAVVYRPSIDRIVDVEPVSIDTPPGAKSTN